MFPFFCILLSGKYCVSSSNFISCIANISIKKTISICFRSLMFQICLNCFSQAEHIHPCLTCSGVVFCSAAFLEADSLSFQSTSVSSISTPTDKMTQKMLSTSSWLCRHFGKSRSLSSLRTGLGRVLNWSAMLIWSIGDYGTWWVIGITDRTRAFWRLSPSQSSSYDATEWLRTWRIVNLIVSWKEIRRVF